MAFDLSIPDPEATKEKVEEELAIEPQHAEIIDTAAAQKGNQIMEADLDSIVERREILQAIEGLGSDIMAQSTAKNEMLARRMVELSRQGGESGEVAKSLEQLAVKMRDLDPSGVDFAKTGPLSKIFNPVRRYFERYKTADAEIADIVQSLEKGKTTLRNDNVTLELEEDSMRALTKQLNQQIEMATDLDTYLSGAIEKAKLEGNVDPERLTVVEEDVLLPLRQKILDFQQLLTVNQQGIVSMNIIRRNNQELVRAVDRAESVTVSALRVAATVAGALYNQRIVLDKVNTLNAATNEMISSTSHMLKEQGTEIQAKAYEANISVDTLKESFEQTLSALEDISNYKQAALPRIKETIEEFQTIAAEGQKYIDRMEKRDEALAAAYPEPAAELPEAE
ncbi:MAG: toxic anion resistance protein [Eggerthellaceae bacterium]|nr:toxic anion resistance protein [Eggerthellaceae bacterium]